MDVRDAATRHVVGGVDTHKDLHVAAVVDERDRVLGSQSFATTRQGYRQLLAWMRSFGEVQRIGIESTGSYGAGLLRFLQTAGIEVLEVTTPDTTRSPPTWKERRSRRAECRPCRLRRPADRYARNAATAWSSRCGSCQACRKTAVAARRVALQMIQNTIVCAPDGVAGHFAQHDPHAAHSHSRRLAAGPDRLSRRGSCLSDHPQVARSPLSRIARPDLNTALQKDISLQ